LTKIIIVLLLVDDELMRDPRLTHPIIIYCFGGVSSLQVGGRGLGGVSADLDFFHVNSASADIITALEDAIVAVWNANYDALAQDFMNTAITTYISPQSIQEIVQQSSLGNMLWRGQRLWVVHGTFGVSLAGKMDKITKEMARDEGAQRKNSQDAVAFLTLAVRANRNVPITYSQLKSWSRQVGKDEATTKKNIINTARRIQSAMPSGPGFSQQILEMAEVDSD
jgi:hypothetical protein